MLSLITFTFFLRKVTGSGLLSHDCPVICTGTFKARIVNFIYLFVISTFKPHLSLLCRSTLLLLLFLLSLCGYVVGFFTFSQRLRFICSLFLPFLSYSSSPPSFLAAPLLYPSGIITRRIVWLESVRKNNLYISISAIAALKSQLIVPQLIEGTLYLIRGF